MTPEELDKLEALVKAATSGEWAFILDADSKAATRGWRQISSGRHRVVAADWYERRSGGEAETVNGVRLGEPDAAAIVALHNAAPALIAAAREVERLRAFVPVWRRLGTALYLYVGGAIIGEIDSKGYGWARGGVGSVVCYSPSPGGPAFAEAAAAVCARLGIAIVEVPS